EELAARRAGVVDAHRRAPACAAVVGVPDLDVRVALLVSVLERVDEVDAAAVRSAGPVPRQPRLGVDRAIRLGRDEVEAADVRVGDEDAIAEAGRRETGRIEAHEELAATMRAL